MKNVLSDIFVVVGILLAMAILLPFVLVVEIIKLFVEIFDKKE